MHLKICISLMIWLFPWSPALGANGAAILVEVGPSPGSSSEPVIGVRLTGGRAAWSFSHKRLWRTATGGTNWTEVALPSPSQSGGGLEIRSADFDSAETGWIWVEHGPLFPPSQTIYAPTQTIYRTNDGGKNWQEQPPLPLTDGTIQTVSFRPGGGVGWVVGARKSPHVRITIAPGCVSPPDTSKLEPDIFHTVDGGRHWVRQELPEASGCPVSEVAFRSDNEGVAVSG